jgi:hypothetical protein
VSIRAFSIASLGVLAMGVVFSLGQSQPRLRGPSAAAAQPVPFKVEIWINEKRLSEVVYKTDGFLWKAGKPVHRCPCSLVYVDVKLKNVSNRDQEIIFWTQPAWSFLSSSPEVQPAIDARQNIRLRWIFRPNEEYQTKVGIWTDAHAPSKSIEFRLGFVPLAERPVSAQKDQRVLEKWGGIVWSNEITFTTLTVPANRLTNPADTVGTFVNPDGWPGEYPPSWQAEALEAVTNRNRPLQPALSGPYGCYERGLDAVQLTSV